MKWFTFSFLFDPSFACGVRAAAAEQRWIPAAGRSASAVIGRYLSCGRYTLLLFDCDGRDVHRPSVVQGPSCPPERR